MSKVKNAQELISSQPKEKTNKIIIISAIEKARIHIITSTYLESFLYCFHILKYCLL